MIFGIQTIVSSKYTENNRIPTWRRVSGYGIRELCRDEVFRGGSLNQRTVKYEVGK